MGARQLICCLAVLVLLTGCNKKASDTSMTNGEGGGTTVTTTGPDGGVGPGPGCHGCQSEFVQNVGDRVFFGYNEYDLTASAKTTIEHQAQYLKTYPTINIMVEGHCDERGTREYNLALGEKRAMAVRNYLVANGVESGRVQTISYGKERPAVLGSDETSWAQNRRGVVVVQ